MLSQKLIHTKTENINNKNHNFLLIHHFQIKNSNYFSSEEELLFNINENKFSIFGCLSDKFQINNRFIFLLEYPEHNCHYYFSQNTNPLNTVTDQNIDMQSLDDETCKGSVSFIGLTRTNTNYPSFLDGSRTSSNQRWYFPIGQKGAWNGAHQMPAFDREQRTKITCVDLWVEIGDMSIINRLFRYYTCKNHQATHYRLLYFCLILNK